MDLSAVPKLGSLKIDMVISGIMRNRIRSYQRDRIVKSTVRLLLLAVVSGCSSPHSPIQLTPKAKLPGVLAPELLDFGTLPLGTQKDSQIIIRNIGTDTVFVATHDLSDSNFRFPWVYDPVKIFPGDSTKLHIRFSPNLLGSIGGEDTLVTSKGTQTISLIGNAIPFSNMFDRAPVYVRMSLTGMIVGDSSPDPGVVTYQLGVPEDGLHSQPTALTFDSSFFGVKKSALVILDTMHSIASSLDFSDSYFKGSITGRGSSESELSLKNILLHRDSNGWSAHLLSSQIPASFTFFQQSWKVGGGGQGGGGSLGPITGFMDTAKLDIFISSR